MMPEGDGLRPLEVGISRHNGADVLLCDVAKRPHKLGYEGYRTGYLITEVETQVEGDLVVTASAGMQALARIPYPCGEGLFYKGMDILCVRREG